MANPIELAVRVKADTKRLWDDLTKVDRKADETKRKVQDIGRESAKVARQAEQQAGRVRTGFARAGQGLGAAGGVLASGGDLGTALAALVGSAFPAFAAAVAGARGGGALIDRLQGEAGKISAAEAILQNPTSVAEGVAALNTVAKNKAGQFSFGRWFRQGGDILTKWGPFGDENPASPGATDRKRERRRRFREMVRANPAYAAAVLAQMGNPDDLAQVYEEETRRMATEKTRMADSEAFMTRYATETTTVNAAVNVSSRVGAGRGSVGRTLTEYQDSRDRNNGRYVATSSRRR